MKSAATTDGSCKRVLVVDDEPDIRESLKMVLELEGYEVFSASNGKEGLDLLPGMPRPCVILLDLMMPVMDGWEFAEALSEDNQLSSIPVVLVTAYADKAEGIAHQGVVGKPVDVDTLLSFVQHHC